MVRSTPLVRQKEMSTQEKHPMKIGRIKHTRDTSLKTDARGTTEPLSEMVPQEDQHKPIDTTETPSTETYILRLVT